MTPEKKYSLISVSSNEEDDIVIQAGAIGEATGRETDVSTENGQTEAESQEGYFESESAIGEVDDPTHNREVIQSAKAQSKVAASANTMLTSEDDLRTPMPYEGMQRIILLVFALLLVVAVVYWIFIRPISG